MALRGLGKSQVEKKRRGLGRLEVRSADLFHGSFMTSYVIDHLSICV